MLWKAGCGIYSAAFTWLKASGSDFEKNKGRKGRRGSRTKLDWRWATLGQVQNAKPFYSCIHIIYNTRNTNINIRYCYFRKKLWYTRKKTKFLTRWCRFSSPSSTIPNRVTLGNYRIWDNHCVSPSLTLPSCFNKIMMSLKTL